MESLNSIPFTDKMSVFEEIEEVANFSKLTEEERDLYDRSVDGYRLQLMADAYSREAGRKEGEYIKAVAIARNLKATNLSIEDIMKATGLSQSEIEQL